MKRNYQLAFNAINFMHVQLISHDQLSRDFSACDDYISEYVHEFISNQYHAREIEILALAMASNYENLHSTNGTG